METDFDPIALFEHDLSGKPIPALTPPLKILRSRVLLNGGTLRIWRSTPDLAMPPGQRQRWRPGSASIGAMHEFLHQPYHQRCAAGYRTRRPARDVARPVA